MSIASKLNTLLNIRDRLRHLLGNRWGKSEALGEGLDGCTTLLEDVNVISEGMYFVPTTTQQRIAPADSYVVEDLYMAGDPDLVSGNIKEGVEIFGVTGTYRPEVLTVGSDAINPNILQFKLKGQFTIIPYVDIYLSPSSPLTISTIKYFKILKLTLTNLNCGNGSYSSIDALEIDISTLYYRSAGNVYVSLSTSYDGVETTFTFTANSTYSREFAPGGHYTMSVVL